MNKRFAYVSVIMNRKRGRVAILVTLPLFLPQTLRNHTKSKELYCERRKEVCNQHKKSGKIEEKISKTLAIPSQCVMIILAKIILAKIKKSKEEDIRMVKFQMGVWDFCGDMPASSGQKT